MKQLLSKRWYIKLSNWEYWPMWIYYIPVWIQHFWLSLKVGNLFFFLRTNPAIDGFILSDSKYRTLQLVPNECKPKTIYVRKGSRPGEIMDEIANYGVQFPIILKPDIGFRGISVKKIDNEQELAESLQNIKVNHIIQEFVDDELEIGLFYYRLPDSNKGVIPSLTIKKFLSVAGDGSSTLGQLIEGNPRAVLHQEKLRKRFNARWNHILPANKIMILDRIGNHNKGTEFRNGNHLIDEELISIFDDLSHKMEGFYFGRFDIKTPSLEALKRDHNYKILEVNGVGGEPTHIYYPDTPFFSVWKDLCAIWRVAAKISKINFRNGEAKPTFREAHSKWLSYNQYKTMLH